MSKISISPLYENVEKLIPHLSKYLKDKESQGDRVFEWVKNSSNYPSHLLDSDVYINKIIEANGGSKVLKKEDIEVGKPVYEIIDNAIQAIVDAYEYGFAHAPQSVINPKDV